MEKLFFNLKYPDGVKRRQLDSNIIKIRLKPKIPLKKGLVDYCEYYLKKSLSF